MECKVTDVIIILHRWMIAWLPPWLNQRKRGCYSFYFMLIGDIHLGVLAFKVMIISTFSNQIDFTNFSCKFRNDNKTRFSSAWTKSLLNEAMHNVDFHCGDDRNWTFILNYKSAQKFIQANSYKRRVFWTKNQYWILNATELNGCKKAWCNAVI